MAEDIADLVVKITGDSTGLMTALGGAERALSGFGSTAGTAFSGMSAAALPIAGILAGIGVAAVESAKTIGGAYKDIEKQTGETGASLNALKTNFDNVFSNVPEDAHTVATALSDVYDKSTTLNGGLALTGQALDDLTTKFLNWSRISGTDVKTLIDSTTQYAIAWKMTGTQVSTAMDQLQVAHEKTGVSMEKLLTDMNTLKTGAARLGLSFEDTAADAALFEKAGVKMTSVNMAMSKTVTEAGKAGQDAGQRWKEDIATLNQWAIQGNTTGISQEKLKQLTDDFGARSLPQMTQALKTSKTDMNNLKTAMDNAGGTITQRAKDTQTFADKWTILKHNLEEALLPLGITLITTLSNIVVALTPVIKGLTDLTKWFGGLPQPVKDVTAAIALCAIGIPILSAAVGILSGVLTTLTTALGLTAVADDTLAVSADATAVSLGAEGTAGTTAAVGVGATGDAAVVATGEMGPLAAAVIAVAIAYESLKLSADAAARSVATVNANAAAAVVPSGTSVNPLTGDTIDTQHNKTVNIPGVGNYTQYARAAGGVFGPRAGGVHAIVAEGGEAEAIIPAKYWGGVDQGILNKLPHFQGGGIVGGASSGTHTGSGFLGSVNSSVSSYVIGGLAAIGAGLSVGAGTASSVSSSIGRSVVSGLSSVGGALATSIGGGLPGTDKTTKDWTTGVDKTTKDWQTGITKGAKTWMDDGVKWGKTANTDVTKGAKTWMDDGVKWGLQAQKDGTTTGTNWKLDGTKWGLQTQKDGTTTGTNWKADGTKWGLQTVADGTKTGTNWKQDGVTMGAKFVTDGGTTGTNFKADGVTTGAKFITDGKTTGTQFIADANTAGAQFAAKVSAAISAAQSAKISYSAGGGGGGGSGGGGSGGGGGGSSYQSSPDMYSSGNPAGDVFLQNDAYGASLCPTCQNLINAHPGATIHYGANITAWQSAASGGIISSTTGGQLALVGEGGEAEAIIPQSMWGGVSSNVLNSLPRMAGGGITGQLAPGVNSLVDPGTRATPRTLDDVYIILIEMRDLEKANGAQTATSTADTAAACQSCAKSGAETAPACQTCANSGQQTAENTAKTAENTAKSAATGGGGTGGLGDLDIGGIIKGATGIATQAVDLLSTAVGGILDIATTLVSMSALPTRMGGTNRSDNYPATNAVPEGGAVEIVTALSGTGSASVTHNVVGSVTKSELSALNTGKELLGILTTGATDMLGSLGDIGSSVSDFATGLISSISSGSGQVKNATDNGANQTKNAIDSGTKSTGESISSAASNITAALAGVGGGGSSGIGSLGGILTGIEGVLAGMVKALGGVISLVMHVVNTVDEQKQQTYAQMNYGGSYYVTHSTKAPVDWGAMLGDVMTIGGGLMDSVKSAISVATSTVSLAVGLITSVAGMATSVAMQGGGIVTKPTYALIGEHGPEAVVPLSHSGGFGRTYEVHVHVNSDVPESTINLITNKVTKKIQHLEFLQSGW